MLKISRPILVEGKYDRAKVLSVADATVIATDGFGIFAKKDLAKMLRKVAKDNGVIVLTDSDSGGLVIRNYLKNILKDSEIIHVYIPQIEGKEKRKPRKSKEGFLGVEGMEKDVLLRVLEPYADGKEPVRRMELNKADFYALGLSGREDSARKRKNLLKILGLPDNLSSTAMIEAVNMTVSKEEFEKALRETEKQDDQKDKCVD